jgi:polysaccharide pyruvyl transferase WcaK-like protein
MKILFTNCWQAGNTGDVAIWKNLMKHLLNAFPHAEFIIVSQNLLDWDVNQLLEYKVKFYTAPLGQIDPLLNAVKEADVVISQGGGYMIGDGMFPYLQAFKLAQDLGKPTFFSTQTFVGPINDETKKLLKEVLNKALIVSPREKGTYDLLKEAGVNEDKLIMAPDTVFDIGIKNYNFPYPDSIKFCIRGYLPQTTVLKEKAKLADMIMETMGQIVFIPVGHGGDRDDRPIMKEIASYMKHKAIIIEDKLTAEEIKSTMKDGIVISSRYHGIIYAASMCTPFIALNPDIGSKMPGLLELLDYPINEVVDKDIFKADILFKYVFDVWNNRIKYRELLKMKMPQIKKDSALIYSKIIGEIKNANII